MEITVRTVAQHLNPLTSTLDGLGISYEVIRSKEEHRLLLEVRIDASKEQYEQLIMLLTLQGVKTRTGDRIRDNFYPEENNANI